MNSHSKNVLIIGGHGKVAQLATPKLVQAGHTVDSLVRSPEQAPDIEALGATPVLGDITQLSSERWTELLQGYDAVVWSAGNGGRGGADLTWAVDRDGAMSVIDALESLRDSGAATPGLVMVSYLGATHNSTDPADEKWYAYVEAKKAVDQRLGASNLDHVILGPSALTEEPAQGISLVADSLEGVETPTSRDLVAGVIAEVISRPEFPASPVSFVDGDAPLSSI